MSGDGTERGGAGLPDESADGTDWLLSQLDADDTEAIETQPATGAVDEQPSAAVAPVPADDDDRTRVLPVVGDTDAQAAASPVPAPVPAEPQWSVPSVPDAPATPTSAEPTPAPVESLPAPVERTPAAAEPTPAAPATAAGQFASEAELLAWWQSQVPNPADESAPIPSATGADTQPAAAQTPVASVEAVAESAPARPEGLRHPNALQLPDVPPTPAPASPVPPVLNELTVDTDSVLQHAPAGTYRPAPTNPVVLTPVDDEPWSLGGSDDSDDDAARTAPEDVSTAVLPTARALAADDPAAWAAVEAEETGATNATSTPAGGTPAAPLPPTGPPVMPTPAAADHDAPSGSATTPDTEVQDDDLPEGSWSLSETFGDDVLGGETVEVRDAAADADPSIDAGRGEETATPGASAPRTDPLAWLTEPFGETFGAAPAPPEEPADEPDEADSEDDDQATVDTVVNDTVAGDGPIPSSGGPAQASAEPIEDRTIATPTPLESVDEPAVATPTPVESSEEPVFATPDASADPVEESAPSTPAEPSSPVTPAAAFRWDTVVAPSPIAAEPATPADVPWPETVPDVDAEPLDETRPFDSLGGPGFSALAGAAAATAAVPPTSMPDFTAEPAEEVSPGGATDTTEVPAAFGPPAPRAERSITELISLDGVQPEPTVSPFGTAPFQWDLAPNDALDPLVHAAPTTQPIPVPAVEWEADETTAVSAESPSELALEGEVPDAAFIAGDVKPFAPGLAAETLGRPLVDGPGDEPASWADDDDEDDTDAAAPVTTPVVPAANDTVDLFPTLSLGGFDAAIAAGGLGAVTGVAAGAAASPGAGEDDADASDDETEATADSLDEHDAPTAPTPTTAPTIESPEFAVDPEELDDEFDEEIVEFDAVPLAAGAAAPLPSFVPEGAEADRTPVPGPDAAAQNDSSTDEVTPSTFGEPEPVSEELRLESLFDLGPETDVVEVVPAEDASSPDESVVGAHPAADPTADPAPAADEPSGTTDEASARSLADTFAAEGGWSLQADAVAAPDLPIAPIPGVVAASPDAADTDTAGTDTAGTDAADTADAARAGTVAAPDAEAGSDDDAGSPLVDEPARGEADASPTVAPVIPASSSVFGAHAAAVPSRASAAEAPLSAPAALPGETVAFPELDGASALTTPAAASGIVGATLPPQATTPGRDRDLPEYRGEHTEQGIPKALIWAVVGLGAAVLLLLAFYFGTLVGAANAAGASAAAPLPSTSATSSAPGTSSTV